MPFQSEKQRRFLHANHPQIAKRWEREYSNGGILDINESEEIISDDGNDIELTDYNAAFDDPKDLSTGVRTLFQAKDGGRIGLYQGGGPHAGGYGTTSSSSNTGGGGHPHGGVASQYSAPSTSTTSTRSKSISEDKYDDWKARQADEIFSRTPSSDLEKYDTKEQHLANIPGDVDYTSSRYNVHKGRVNANYTEAALDLAEKNQRAALNKWGLGQLGKIGVMLAAMVGLYNVPLMDALKAVPKTISLTKEDLATLVKESLPVAKAKKAHIEALENYTGGLLKNVDTTNPNEMVNVEETTDFTQKMNELKDLTQTRDEDEDTRGGDDPELPPQLGGTSTEEMATEYVEQPDFMGWMRANQERKKAYDEKIERERQAREENPIVTGTETDIIAIGNKGGLANLFRVKNQ